jgi:hypothetical protein
MVDTLMASSPAEHRTENPGAGPVFNFSGDGNVIVIHGNVTHVTVCRAKTPAGDGELTPGQAHQWEGSR